ncbi:MAG: peptidoglycan DD-metalloendopeptidase family protein [Clostridia bacterium]|nr:peptidoglycan DD-metalloendopeptidase family protein [Clostridia bacterium]
MGDVITLIIDCIKSTASTIKNSSNKAKQGIFAGVAVLAILASLSFTGARIAYKVNYSGHTIATVSSKKQFNEALQLVVSMVNGKGVETVVEEPEFNTTVVLSENINNTTEVADAIIDNTDAIVRASTLYVDGNAVARAEKRMLDSIINNRLNSFNVENQQCTSRFVGEVLCEDGYLMATNLDSKSDVEAVVNSLAVITEMRQVTDVMVPYKSTVQKTNEQIVGYSAVTVTGVSGVNRVTQDIVMVNGEVQSCVEVSNEVVVAPVNEVIVKGTAKTLASAKQKQAAHSAGFIFPVPAGSWKVSSYYGDGRNHKGIDICAKSGTSIYAVADGTVVYSGWKGDYGYCVIIEHEGGMRTLYAHAKQLCCNVGDIVSQGEIIALVGTTGQSTGNHVHFEVIANGRNVDPAPYINLD